MRLAAGLLLLIAALWLASMWDIDALQVGVSDTILVGAGVGVVLLGWMIGRWLRKRQRRRMLDTRDSALW
jgi:thiol:disulfide interchange protein